MTGLGQHLCRFEFIRRSNVDQLANFWMVIELSEESLCLLILAYLSDLERDGIWAVLLHTIQVRKIQLCES